MSTSLASPPAGRRHRQLVGWFAVIGVAALALASGAAAAPPPGPPFPDPVLDQAVYDYADIFSSGTETTVEATIDTIEARTGAEVAVYSQVLDYTPTTEQAEADARALMDQWGVGRRGFDDGLVILFDLDPSRAHGQVQLYAGAGFKSTFLTDSERQAIFDNDMLPNLRAGDLDGALLAAMTKIDAATTKEHAGRLELARVIDAVLGLLVAPLVFIGLLAFAFRNWLRFGRDPQYLDDPSILMPAPPPDLTAASGAVLMAGQSNRRALTAALLDLASRGQLSFREEPQLLGLGRKKVGIETQPPAGDEMTEALRTRNQRRPLSGAEEYLATELREIADAGTYLEPEDVLKLGAKVATFDERVEAHVASKGWMTERPGAVISRWRNRGIGLIIGGIVAAFLAAKVPIAGLVAVGAAVALGGLAIVVLATWMPAVTMAGAMLRAMLAAYRRTLEKTMAQARSMQQVVEQAGLTWLETPDQAVVWGTALGLQDEIERVLARSLDDVREGRAGAATYFPAWYAGSSGSPATASSVSSGGGGGLFSSSAIPNFGGMMGVLGSVGNSPSSSGGGGGFGGGGGGGGGGAGGGF